MPLREGMKSLDEFLTEKKVIDHFLLVQKMTDLGFHHPMLDSLDDASEKLGKSLGLTEDELSTLQLNKATAIQSLIFDKKKFKTEKEVRDWVVAHNFHVTKRLGAQLWGSAAGKSKIVYNLMPLFPKHKIYCEPFAGGCAVFWAKDKSDVEVLNDIDKDIAESLRFVQLISDDQLLSLKRMNWKVSLDHFKKLKASSPTSATSRFHRMVMLRYAGFMRNPDSSAIDSKNDGRTLNLFDQIPRAKERLRGVKIYNEDYRKILSKYDDPHTFFFLDPPYTKTNQHVGERNFDHTAFWDSLNKIRGKFLVTYDAPDPNKKFNLQILEHRRTVNGSNGSKASDSTYKTYIITNYETKRIDKIVKGGIEETANTWRVRQQDPSNFVEGSFRMIDLADGIKAVIGQIKETTKEAFVKFIPVEKTDDRKIVLGIVLEPDEVDSQGDTISAAEIENAAHAWLAKFQNRGYMHRENANEKIQIFESYLAPTELTFNDQKVKKGSWLLMYHILDDDLWNQIKKGEITGFSMGGFARRVAGK